jgi:hypothetical protein
LDSENKWMKQKKGLVKKMKEKRWFLWWFVLYLVSL